MKRIFLALAVVALVVTLLPAFWGGAPAAVADSDTPVPSADAGAPAPPASDSAPLRYAAGLSSAADLALVDRLQAAAGPARVATHLATGRVRFIGAEVDRAGFAGVATGLDGQPDAAARAFLAGYGPLFGIQDPASLTVMSQKTDAPGGASAASSDVRTFVRYQQTINGIPVFGGELIVQVDAAGVVWSASGEALPASEAAALPAEATMTAEQAAQIALRATAKYEQTAAEGLRASAPELWYYAPALLGRPEPGARLVWRTEVTPVDLLPIRQVVLVDATTGKLALQFNQIAHAKNRRVYDNQNNSSAGLPGFGPVRSEGQGLTGNNDVDKAYDYAGDTYDFYMSRHGRDSLDGAGLALISTVRYCDPRFACPYQNAFWNGAQMAYGQGFAAADDVVAHELTHGVTDYESQLFYYMQSGALNESLSDIWGEFVDLTNGKGNDSAGVKWLVNEDGPASLGVLRSMANPPAYGDPDSMSHWQYKCSLDDLGGVHSNSGVPNKAAYLMTDGGTFGGKTVSPLGIEKVARIWYRMATLNLTSAGEFQDAYDLLPQACLDLANVNAAGITNADCQQVRNALDATKMNGQPANCGSTEAPVCAAGEGAQYLYSEDFENQGLTKSRWASAAAVGPNPWYYPQTANPYQGWDDFHYATSGLYHLWGDNLDQTGDGWMQMTSGVKVPAAGKAYMRFRHAYEFEYNGSSYFDGGVVEYSANGGPWTDAGSLFTHNGYDGTINSPIAPFNPLKGRQGFRAVSWGYQSSRLDLASLKGQDVRFRFRVGADSADAFLGWLIDDVTLYACVVLPTPTPTPTFTPTPTRTPNTPWINWATNALPPASLNRPRPARVLYGSISSPQSVTATISGGAVFGDNTASQAKTVPPANGETFFDVKAKPGAAPGTTYTLTVKMGSSTITRTGRVAREVRLPLLLK
jgi:bacillolysin